MSLGGRRLRGTWGGSSLGKEASSRRLWRDETEWYVWGKEGWAFRNMEKMECENNHLEEGGVGEDPSQLTLGEGFVWDESGARMRLWWRDETSFIRCI